MLPIVREVTSARNEELWLWSITNGVHDGLMLNTAGIADTEHPAAALCHFIQSCNRRSVIAMLDLVGHLKDEKTLRMFRDAIEKIQQHRGTIILIDSRDELPPAIDVLTTRFELSLPDDAAVEQCIRQTLREINAEQHIEIAVTRKGLTTMVKNLRGLNCRQVRQIVIDSVADDLRFDDNDCNSILAEKRRALGGGSLLEYVESPATLEEIGGLTKLKSWLNMRQNCLGEEAAAFGIPRRAAC